MTFEKMRAQAEQAYDIFSRVAGADLSDLQYLSCLAAISQAESLAMIAAAVEKFLQPVIPVYESPAGVRSDLGW